MKYIIANWKAHKTLAEAEAWVDSFLELISHAPEVKEKLEQDQLKILIAAPIPFLYPLSPKISQKNTEVIAQDVSANDEGPYTGEVTAKMLEGLISYALVGHSERREHFLETDETVLKKAFQSTKHNIVPIVCVQNESNSIPTGSVVAYEPKGAIGTGNNTSIGEVVSLKKKLNLPQGTAFLYGGSVDEKTVDEYVDCVDIDGLLVGRASLDPDEFFSLVRKYAR